MAFLNIIVLAHKHSSQLKRLVNRLSHPDVKVFIHFDAKMKTIPTERELKASNPNVTILPERYSNYLDTWTLVHTTMKCYRYIADNQCVDGGGGGYFALMSAQDYPIKPIASLVETLKQSEGAAYIDISELREGSWLSHKLKHTYAYAEWYKIAAKMPNRFLKRCTLKGFHIIEPLIRPFSATVRKQIKRNGIEIYGGSAWWILPDSILCAINREYTENQGLLHTLRGIITPEEVYFQTMAMRVGLSKEKIAKCTDIGQNCLTFANFITPTKPFCGHPYALTMEDFGRIQCLPHFFARKFDENVDSHILDMIDVKLLGITYK